MSYARALLLATVLVTVTLTCALFGQNQRTIKMDVDLVLIPTTVTNSQHRYVSNLSKDNFEILEDKVEQKITEFGMEDAPMSLGIVLDTSESMRGTLGFGRRNAQRCVDVGTEADEYFLILFSDRPYLITDFTTDIRRLQTELAFVQAKGSTALYDAIFEGLTQMKRAKNPRKALIVVTDGYENHSRGSAGKARDAVKEQDVQVFSLGNEGDGALRELTIITGGQGFSTRFPGYQLGDICGRIVQDLKNQYVLGYRSTNEIRDGRWRSVRVKVDPPKGMSKLNVHAKTGYYALER
jgi:Ca-activated chloride channel family protein